MNNSDLENFLYLGCNSSENLAAMVVVYRALGLNKALALLCMSELVRRRSLGEEFSYEEFIDSEIKKINLIPSHDVSNIFSNMKVGFNSLLSDIKK